MFRRIPPRPTCRTRFPAQKKDEDAMANSPVKFPVHVQGMNDFMKEFVWHGDSQMMNIPDFGMCFVTCENEYGASALFYPGFLEQVAKRFRGKFFILP